MIDNLIRISTYAKSQNVSVGWVHQLAKDNKIKIVEIDKMKFVDLEKSKTQIKK